MLLCELSSVSNIPSRFMIFIGEKARKREKRRENEEIGKSGRARDDGKGKRWGVGGGGFFSAPFPAIPAPDLLARKQTLLSASLHLDESFNVKKKSSLHLFAYKHQHDKN